MTSLAEPIVNRPTKKGPKQTKKSNRPQNPERPPLAPLSGKEYSLRGQLEGQKPLEGQEIFQGPGDSGRDGSSETEQQSDEEALPEVDDDNYDAYRNQLSSVTEDPFYYLEEQVVDLVPANVARITASLGPTLKAAWTATETGPLRAKIKEVNDEMGRALSAEGDYQKFQVPSDQLVDLLEHSRNVINSWRTNTKESLRFGTALVACKHMLQLLPMLAQCGLSWKLVVDEELLSEFQEMIDAVSPELPQRVQDLLRKYILEDFDRPSVVQVALVREFEQEFSQKLTHVPGGSYRNIADVPDIRWMLKKLNDDIKAHNERAGLPTADHQLPIRLLGSREEFLAKIYGLGFHSLRMTIDNHILAQDGAAQANVDPSTEVRDSDGDARMQDAEGVDGTFLQQANLATPRAGASAKATAASPPPSFAVPQSGPSTTTRIAASTASETSFQSRGVFGGVPGPIFSEDGATLYGTIIKIHTWSIIRKKGPEVFQARVIVNRGCEEYPIYEMIPGSALPRQFIRAMLNKPTADGSSYRLDNADVSPLAFKDVEKCTDVALVASGSPHVKYFRILWADGSCSWHSRGKLNKGFGKYWIEKKVLSIVEHRRQNHELKIEVCRNGNLHPNEPSRKISEQEKAKFPWIFWDVEEHTGESNKD